MNWGRGDWISYIFIATFKHHGQSNFKKEDFIWGLPFQRERSQITNRTQPERELGMVYGLETSKSTLSDTGGVASKGISGPWTLAPLFDFLDPT